MPWQQNPGSFLETMHLLIVTCGAVVLGTFSRIIEQLQSGERARFWSRRLLIDAVGVVVMVLISVGISEYYDLGRWAHAALAVGLGKVGSRAFDLLIEALMYRIKRGVPGAQK